MVAVHLKVKRYDPEVDKKPRWQEYEVEIDSKDRVLDALHEAKWHHDGTLTFRRSWNGLACGQLIENVGTNITLEPIRGLPVIKDLVVDMEPFFAQYRSILPYLINGDDPGYKERHQSADDRERYDDTTKCILCACCTTSCPVYWGNSSYVGPAAIVNAHRFIFDSRDQAAEQRLDILNEKSGVFRCRTAFNCTDACPRGIKVTQAIEEVKRALLFDRV
jgi:succinate dehydrogenase / fumarate reductase iron-sulfur subunit